MAFDFSRIRYTHQEIAPAEDPSPPPPQSTARHLIPHFQPPPAPPPPPSHHIVHHRPPMPPTAATGAIPRTVQAVRPVPRSPPSASATSGALGGQREDAAAMAAAFRAAAEAEAEAAARSRAAAAVERMDLSDHAVTSTSRPGHERAPAARVEQEESIAHVAPARRGGGSGKDLKELLPAVRLHHINILIDIGRNYTTKLPISELPHSSGRRHRHGD